MGSSYRFFLSLSWKLLVIRAGQKLPICLIPWDELEDIYVEQFLRAL